MTVPAQKRIAPASFFPMPMLIRSGQKDTILSEAVFSGRLFCFAKLASSPQSIQKNQSNLTSKSMNDD